MYTPLVGKKSQPPTREGNPLLHNAGLFPAVEVLRPSRLEMTRPVRIFLSTHCALATCRSHAHCIVSVQLMLSRLACCHHRLLSFTVVRVSPLS